MVKQLAKKAGVCSGRTAHGGFCARFVKCVALALCVSRTGEVLTCIMMTPNERSVSFLFYYAYNNEWEHQEVSHTQLLSINNGARHPARKSNTGLWRDK